MSANRWTVLGASGYVGASLVNHLRARGFEVFAPARHDECLFHVPLGKVVYCNGMTSNFLADPSATLHAHVAYLDTVLRKCDFERIVYLSSCRLYDSRAGELCKESDPLRLAPAQVRHLYDLSKALGENLCLTTSHGRGSVARLACVYDDSPRAGGFLPDLLKRLRNQRDIVLNTVPESARDYVHLRTVMSGLERLATHSQGSLVANLASGQNVSNGQLADMMARAGWRVSFKGVEESPVLAAAPVCDVTCLKGDLGVDPIQLDRWLPAWLTRLEPH